MIRINFHRVLILVAGTLALAGNGVAGEPGFPERCREAYRLILKRKGVTLIGDSEIYDPFLESKVAEVVRAGGKEDSQQVAKMAIQDLKKQMNASNAARLVRPCPPGARSCLDYMDLSRTENFSKLTFKAGPGLEGSGLNISGRTAGVSSGISLERVLKTLRADLGTLPESWVDGRKAGEAQFFFGYGNGERMASAGLDRLLTYSGRTEVEVFKTYRDIRPEARVLVLKITDPTEYLEALSALTDTRGWLLKVPVQESWKTPENLESFSKALERSGAQWAVVGSDLVVVPGDLKSARVIEKLHGDPGLDPKRILAALEAVSAPQVAPKEIPAMVTRAPDLADPRTTERYAAAFRETTGERIRRGVPQVLRAHGITGLRHYTALEGLELILKDRHLHPRAKLGDSWRAAERIKGNGTGDPTKVYFKLTRQDGLVEASSREDLLPFSNGITRKLDPSTGYSEEFDSLRKVLLFFSDAPLENGTEYHIGGRFSKYGIFEPGDFKYERDGFVPAELEKFLKENDPQVGEVVFYDAIPLTELKSVWVFPAYRDELIRRLRNAGITSFNGKPVEELVRSPRVRMNYKIEGQTVRIK